MQGHTLMGESPKEKLIFWVHIVLVFIAWFGPFIFWWPLMVAGYSIIQLQFYVYKACLMNGMHGLEEQDDTTFYSHVFEYMGYRPDRKKLKFFIRQVIYIVLALFTIFWQVYLENEHLLQF
ncbi:MAG: hypothetical protein AB8F74_15085 [Saprospiraceae bacterium]